MTHPPTPNNGRPLVPSHARFQDDAAAQTGTRDAASDADRLADLRLALDSLEERESLLVRLRQDHHRAGADLERRLSTLVPSGAESCSRSSL